MKKIYILLFALVATIGAASAQGLTQPWWSVKGGVNFSNLSSPDYSTNYFTGYKLGVSYNYPISQTIPIYIEAGLSFQQRGARDNGFLVESGDDSKFTRYELQVPILLGYSVPLSSDWSINPFLGLYYSVALNGKFELDGDDFDPYKEAMLQTLRDAEASEQQLLHRSDFGMSVGLSAHYNRYSLGFAYDAGFLNLYTSKLRDQGYRAQSGCFTIQVGYNF